MTEKTLTTENIKPALDALRGELAPWPVVAKKQDRLNTAQLNAANSGITSSLVAQIIANTAAIRALESAITGTGLRALVVASLPAIGTQGILYIVPVTTYDPATDADVVNYSNEYIWIVAPDAPVTEGYYEQVGQTGIVINNGQLTITVNGTSVGTFTANQSGDTTAAITVPTNADYVDRTTDQTVAGVKTFSSTINGTASKAIADEDGTSIKTGYVKVAGNQTVTGQKTWSGIQIWQSALYVYNSDSTASTPQLNLRNGKVTKGTTTDSGSQIIQYLDKDNKFLSQITTTKATTGTTQLSFVLGNLDSNSNSLTSSLVYSLATDGTKQFIPGTNSTHSLGSSSYQWSSVYAQTYYYNGTAWGLDKANVWTQTNYFTKDFIINSEIAANTQSALSGSKIRQIIFNDSSNSNYFFRLRQYVDATSSRMQFNAQGFDSNNQAYGATFVYRTNSSGNTELYPGDNNQSLGNSTNKWKTLNGINPGALSLPDYDETKALSVDTTGWTYDGSTANQLKINNTTQTINGWLFIRIENVASTDRVVIRFNGNLASDPAMSFSPAGTGINLIMPIPANRLTNIYLTKAPLHIKLYPCLGNV